MSVRFINAGCGLILIVIAIIWWLGPPVPEPPHPNWMVGLVRSPLVLGAIGLVLAAANFAQLKPAARA